MASKLTWLAGVTLAIGTLTHGGMAVAQSRNDTCTDDSRAAPVRPPQLLASSADVKSAAEYAYAQNRRLVFREANREVTLVKFPHSNFYRVMRHKLDWGGTRRPGQADG